MTAHETLTELAAASGGSVGSWCDTPFVAEFLSRSSDEEGAKAAKATKATVWYFSTYCTSRGRKVEPNC